MTFYEAYEVLDDILNAPNRDEAAQIIIKAVEKHAVRCDTTHVPHPATPSGMIAVYEKPCGKKRKKKPGQKKGHKGHRRPAPEHSDHKRIWKLQQCPYCATPLGKSVRRRKRYIEDIAVTKASVTEEEIHGYWCPGCKKIVEPKIDSALSKSTVGITLVIVTAWLHYFIGISVSNIVRILKCLSAIEISAGGLTQSWNRLAVLLKEHYAFIWEQIKTSAVLYADETGWRISGKTHWLWSFSTKTMCYYAIDKCRGSPVIKKILGTFFNGILVCDFWGAYNKIRTLAKQRCIYHLFTELLKVDKKNASRLWKIFKKKLSRILKDAVRLSERRHTLSSDKYQQQTIKIHTRLHDFINDTGFYNDSDCKRLLKRLRRHENELLTFLEHDDVSPYNNHAEQQMRRPVISRKISHQNRSLSAAETQAILMSIFCSFNLQNKNPILETLNLAKTKLSITTNTNDESLKIAA